MTPEEVKTLYQAWKTKQQAVKSLEDQQVAAEAQKQIAAEERRVARNAYESALDTWLTT
jgi:hypothetical protein